MGKKPKELSYLPQAGKATAYNSSLSCFGCVMAGYIYCVQGGDHDIVGKTAPAGYCCKSYQTCPYVTRAGWTCSSSYNDQLYSLHMCPFDPDSCGSTSAFNLSKSATV